MYATYFATQPTHPYNTPLFPAGVGVVVIVASWFISPLLAGLMSYLLYTLLRLAVLRGPSSYKKAVWCLPILLFATLFVNMFFILYKVRQAKESHGVCASSRTTSLKKGWAVALCKQYALGAGSHSYQQCLPVHFPCCCCCCGCAQGVRNIIKIPVLTAVWASIVAGEGLTFAQTQARSWQWAAGPFDFLLQT